MVGHNHVETERGALLHFGERTNAAVNRDHNTRALFLQIFERVLVETISFVDAMRNVRQRFCAQHFERVRQERGGTNSIRIKITIHRNRFAFANRAANAFHRNRHAAHQERVCERVTIADKTQRVLACGNPAIEKNLRQQRRKFGKPRAEIWRRGRLNNPTTFMHKLCKLYSMLC